MGGGQCLFKGKHGKCAQEVLLMAKTENIYPKARPVQMYRCLNTNTGNKQISSSLSKKNPCNPPAQEK